MISNWFLMSRQSRYAYYIRVYINNVKYLSEMPYDVARPCHVDVAYTCSAHTQLAALCERPAYDHGIWYASCTFMGACV